MRKNHKDPTGGVATTSISLPLAQYTDVDIVGDYVYVVYTVRVLEMTADKRPSPCRKLEFCFDKAELFDLVPRSNVGEMIRALGKVDRTAKSLMVELKNFAIREKKLRKANAEEVLNHFENDSRYYWRVEMISKLDATTKLFKSIHCAESVLIV